MQLPVNTRKITLTTFIVHCVTHFDLFSTVCKDCAHDLIGLYPNPPSLIPRFDTPLSHHQFQSKATLNQLCFDEAMSL
jgi:hypothetical protein